MASTDSLEPLLSRAESPSTSRSLFSWKVLVAAVCGVSAVLLVATVVVPVSSRSKDPKHNNSHHHHHHGHGYDYGEEGRSTAKDPLPTLLKVVNHETGKAIDCLSNPLYETLKKANFEESGDRDAPSDNSFQLNIDDNRNEDYPILQRGDSLTVSWRSEDEGGSYFDLNATNGIVALYCPGNAPHESFIEAATLEQAAYGSVDSHSWHIPRFPVVPSHDCEFRMFQQSGPATFSLFSKQSFHLGLLTPINIHLAFGNDPTKMVVQFSTANSEAWRDHNAPVVSYGPTSGDEAAFHAEGASTTYSADDMCQEPANLTEAGKFQDPGMLHTITMADLTPLTEYSYKVGIKSGQGVVWSDMYTFTSAPADGHGESFSYIVYGDQGCPSVGWGNGGTYTSTQITKELENITSVHHFGDLSYARGAGHIWEEWFQQIEPYTSRVPLMIGVGNHEYDHTAGGTDKDPSGVADDHGFMPSWGNYGQDSGGECGVPTSKRFTMPSSNEQSNGVFWYSYNYATVHTIMISSEHNLTEGSPQYEFLKNDLASVNRTVTPWLVVEMHRSMYESEAFWREMKVAKGLRDQAEDLLNKYEVDLVLSGHYHAYLRTCDGLYRYKCSNGGPTYITVGTAGAHLDMAVLYPQHWTDKFIQQQYGYGRITIHNASALHFEFVVAGPQESSATGTVEDEVWILRERERERDRSDA